MIPRCLLTLTLMLVPCVGLAAPPLRFALISHTYYLIPHQDIQDRLVRSINCEQPRYLFALGDSALMNRDQDWDSVLGFFPG